MQRVLLENRCVDEQIYWKDSIELRNDRGEDSPISNLIME